MLGTQITFIQGSGAPNFHIWHWNLGDDFKNSHWKVLRRAKRYI